MQNRSDDTATDSRNTYIYTYGYPEYDGDLYGDLTGRKMVARFRLQAENRTTGDPITDADIYGDRYSPTHDRGPAQDPRINLYFAGNFANGGTQQYWFSQPMGMPVYSMTWNEWYTIEATLTTTDFDNVNGGPDLVGDFNDAVATVEELGFGFGSGYGGFIGFAYRDGVDAPIGTFQVDYISTAAIPEPATLSLGLVATLGLLARRKR